MKYISAITLIYIYAIATGAGLDVWLPALRNFEGFKPFLVFTPMLALSGALLISKDFKVFKDFARVFKYMSLWAVIVLTHTFVFGSNSAANFVSVGSIIHAFLIVSLFLVILHCSITRKHLINGFLIGLVVAVILNLTERIFLLPFTIYTNRSAGLFLNPNGSAEAIVFLMMGRTLYERASLLSVNQVIALTVMGVVATFSRGGLILLFVVVGSLIFRKAVSLGSILKLVGKYSAIFVAVLLLGTMLKNIDFGPLRGEGGEIIAKDGATSILSERFGIGESKRSNSSGKQRIDLAVSALKRILDEKIILGNGAGALFGEYQRTHNYFLESWIEFGFFSLFFMPIVLIFFFNGNWHHDHLLWTFGLLLFVICFFSHNVLNSKPILFCAAVAIWRWRERFGPKVL